MTTNQDGSLDIVVPEDVITDNHRWKCSICDTKFEKKEDAMGHTSSHENESVPAGTMMISAKQFYPKNARLFCPVLGCKRTRTGSQTISTKNGRPFNSLFEVRRHWLRTHSEKRPYVCDSCPPGSKVFRFALKSDLKEHQMTCGKKNLVWICSTQDCNTHCGSKKALVRHCKRFAHQLPNPLAPTELPSGKKILSKEAQKNKEKKQEPEDDLPPPTSEAFPIQKRVAVSGSILMAFEGITPPETNNRRRTSNGSEVLQNTTKKRASREGDSDEDAEKNLAKIKKVVSGSKLMALEAALSTY